MRKDRRSGEGEVSILCRPPKPTEANSPFRRSPSVQQAIRHFGTRELVRRCTGISHRRIEISREDLRLGSRRGRAVCPHNSSSLASVSAFPRSHWSFGSPEPQRDDPILSRAVRFLSPATQQGSPQPAFFATKPPTPPAANASAPLGTGQAKTWSTPSLERQARPIAPQASWPTSGCGSRLSQVVAILPGPWF